MDCVVHLAFLICVAGYKMQWCITLHMHGDIALNGCECKVEKSTLCLVFDQVDLVKWDEVQQSRTVE